MVPHGVRGGEGGGASFLALYLGCRIRSDRRGQGGRSPSGREQQNKNEKARAQSQRRLRPLESKYGLKQSCNGRQSLLPPVSRQGFFPQILEERLSHFLREMLECHYCAMEHRGFLILWPFLVLGCTPRAGRSGTALQFFSTRRKISLNAPGRASGNIALETCGIIMYSHPESAGKACGRLFRPASACAAFRIMPP